MWQSRQFSIGVWQIWNFLIIRVDQHWPEIRHCRFQEQAFAITTPSTSLFSTSLLSLTILGFSFFQRIGDLTREEGTTSVDRRRGRQRRVVSASVCGVRYVDRVYWPRWRCSPRKLEVAVTIPEDGGVNGIVVRRQRHSRHVVDLRPRRGVLSLIVHRVTDWRHHFILYCIYVRVCRESDNDDVLVRGIYVRHVLISRIFMATATMCRFHHCCFEEWRWSVLYEPYLYVWDEQWS
jgi:hypothetical protein